MSEKNHGQLQIGRILRQARYDKGLSLEEVEEATRIRERYLEALEKEEYEVLPAAVYVRGFLKTYADFLGLDGDELAEEVKRQQAPLFEERQIYELPKEEEFDEFDDTDPEPGALTPIGLGRALGRFLPALTLAVLAVAVLVGILYFIGRGTQPSQNEGAAPPPAKNSDNDGGADSKSKQPGNGEDHSKQPPPETTSASSKEPKKEETTAEQPPAPDSIQAKVSVSNSPSWLDIQTDGEHAFTGLGRPGFSKTFEAKHELSISTGNAGAVELEVNGQKVGSLGASGEVLTRKFTLKTETSGG